MSFSPSAPSSSSASAFSPSQHQSYAKSKRPRSSRSGSGSAPASASTSAPRVHDVYYGHEETATTAARYIQSLFACPTYATVTNSSKRTSLPEFIAYALHRTRLSPFVTTASLVLLSRLKARFPSAKGSSGARLWLSAFMAASKSLCDDTYSNASWVIVGQDFFPIGELNKMEREFLSYLEFNCVTPIEDILSLERHLHYNFSAPQPSACRPVYSTRTSATPITINQADDGQYDAYPSPPHSPVSLSFSDSSNHSSPSATLSTPSSTYSVSSSSPSAGVTDGFRHSPSMSGRS